MFWEIYQWWNLVRSIELRRLNWSKPMEEKHYCFRMQAVIMALRRNFVCWEMTVDLTVKRVRLRN